MQLTLPVSYFALFCNFCIKNVCFPCTHKTTKFTLLNVAHSFNFSDISSMENDCIWPCLKLLISAGKCDEVLEFLLQHDIDPSELVSGRFILTTAAQFANLELAATLSELDVPDIIDDMGWSPVIGAIHSGSVKMLSKILHAGYKMDTSPIDCLRLASELNFCSESILLLLKKGAPTRDVKILHKSLHPVFAAAGWKLHCEVDLFKKPDRVYSLLEISRCAIRVNLCQENNLIVQVEKLPLPRALKSFLLFGFDCQHDSDKSNRGMV